VARAMILPLAVAQFIASYAATNMNVAIGTIATDLSTSVPGLQTTMTLFTLHHGVVDDSREQAVRHPRPHQLLHRRAGRLRGKGHDGHAHAASA